MAQPEYRLSDDGEPDWQHVAAWWQREVVTDRTYDTDLISLVGEVLGSVSGRTILDVGCGEGRLARVLEGATIVGVDRSMTLLSAARMRPGMRLVRAELPDLACFVDGAFHGAIASLVFEHLVDHRRAFAGLSRVVQRGGWLSLVINHPIFTAPDSAPIQDADGEMLWRPGRYFSTGFTDEPAGKGVIRFHHRTMGDLLNAAADAGWSLMRLVESGPLPAQLEATPTLSNQMHIPRLMAAKWERT